MAAFCLSANMAKEAGPTRRMARFRPRTGRSIWSGPSSISERYRPAAPQATPRTLTLDGPFTNSGTISTSDATVNLGGNVTLEDLGNFAYSSTTGDAYTNFTNTTPVALNLQGTLTLDTVDPSISTASVGVGDTLDATQGTFANLALDGGTIQGGTVIASSATAGAGALGLNGTGTIHDANVVNAGQLDIATLANATDTLVIDGTLDNSGTVLVGGGSCASAYLRVGADGLTLDGGGVVTISDTGNASVLSNYSAATLTNVDNTIQGYGTVGDNYLTIQNDGTKQNNETTPATINANVSGQTLYLAPYGLFTNDGLAEATNGGILSIGEYGEGSWTNAADGTISASGGGLDLVGPFNNLGTIELTNATLDLTGPFTNTGTFDVSGGSIHLEGASTLSSLATIDITGATVTLNGVLALNGGVLDTTQGVFEDLYVDGGTIDPGTVIDGPGAR